MAFRLRATLARKVISKMRGSPMGTKSVRINEALSTKHSFPPSSLTKHQAQSTKHAFAAILEDYELNLEAPSAGQKMPPLDPVIEAYKVDVDRSLLLENLKLTPQQRFDKFAGVMRNLMNLRTAGQRARDLRSERPTSNETSGTSSEPES